MMTIEFTRRGYIEVWKGTTRISQHTSEYEAIESLSKNGPGDYEIRFPRIMAKAYGVLSPGGDTIPPTQPGSLTAVAASATTVNLSWTQSTDNIGVAGYQIFRDGVPVATTSNLSYTDTGRSPSTQYSYTITAFDAAGNNSTAAGPALVTTNANSAPVWSLGNRSYNNGSAVNISLDGVCTDADGDTITYSLVSGSLPTGLALSGARNQTLSGTVTADGSYAFTLGASDGIAATQTVSLTFTVSTPDTTAPNPPSAPTVSTFTSSTITLSLPTSAASDHASYTIQRSSDGTNYGNRATGITASTWQDTGLSASTTYYYRLIDVDTSNNASVPGAAVSRTTSAPTSEPWDLTANGTRTVPFAYTWPDLPVTSGSPISVTSASAFNSAASVSGRVIRIDASWSQSSVVNITASDIDVIIPAGITVGAIQIGGWPYSTTHHRIRIRGSTPGTHSGGLMGQYRDGNISGGNNCSDITIDGIDINGASPFGGAETNQGFRVSANKIAVLNSRVIAGGYTWLGSATNVIIANSNFYHGAMTRSAAGFAEGWGIRNTGGPFICVDSRIQGTRYVAIRTYPNNDTGDVMWVAGCEIVEVAEGQSIWLWENLNTTANRGDYAMVEDCDIYLYSATGGDLPRAEDCDYSRIRNCRWYYAGSPTYSAAALGAREAGYTGDHDWTVGHTFSGLPASEPAWGGPGNPKLVPLPGGLTPIAGEGSNPGYW